MRRVSKDEAQDSSDSRASWFETPYFAQLRYAGLLTMRSKGQALAFAPEHP